jgi:hypothetical protein
MRASVARCSPRTSRSSTPRPASCRPSPWPTRWPSSSCWATRRDARYDRAAAKWVARLILEQGLDLTQAQRALAAIAGLTGNPGNELVLKDYINS